MRDTSLSAYKELKIEPLEEKILKTVMKRKNMTRQEISKATGIGINSVCGRVCRMVEWNVLDEKDKRKCRVTGKTVWAVSA